MTIASEITRINNNIASAYTAAEGKGATLPEIQNSANLAATINTITGGSSQTKYGANISSFLGDIASNGALQAPTEPSDLVFTGVELINSRALKYKFAYSSVKSVSFPDLITIGNSDCENTFYYSENLETASFPSLTTIDSSGCYEMFSDCTSLTSVELPNLISLTGMQAMYGMFDSCRSLTSISFPKLTNIKYGVVCKRMFYGCSALTDVYFNALTTTSFGSVVNQFRNMMGGTGNSITHTLHFPNNLESKIQNLTGYPTFGGSSGYVVLAFDLPAIS